MAGGEPAEGTLYEFGNQQPIPVPVPVPAPLSVAPTPPSTVEALAGGLHRLVWLVALVLVVGVHTPLAPTVIIACVAGFVLNHIHHDLRRQRLSRRALPPPAPPADLR